eukprot:762757-Hanusia_phi.AAC.3
MLPLRRRGPDAAAARSDARARRGSFRRDHGMMAPESERLVGRDHPGFNAMIQASSWYGRFKFPRLPEPLNGSRDS